MQTTLYFLFNFGFSPSLAPPPPPPPPPPSVSQVQDGGALGNVLRPDWSSQRYRSPDHEFDQPSTPTKKPSRPVRPHLPSKQEQTEQQDWLLAVDEWFLLSGDLLWSEEQTTDL